MTKPPLEKLDANTLGHMVDEKLFHLEAERDEARREAEELARTVDQEIAEVELQTGLAETRGKQIAALREALTECCDWLGQRVLDIIPAIDVPATRARRDMAARVLFDTAKSAEQYQRVPEGYVVVPGEPTKAMAEAWASLALERIRDAVEGDMKVVGMVEGAKENYKAMLAAAPQAREGENR